MTNLNTSKIGVSDLNQDGKTTADDLSLLLKFLAKHIETLEGGSTQHQFQAVNLTEQLTLNMVEGKVSDDAFRASQDALAANLLRQTTLENESHENLMISPLSISLALSMTANGAQNQTRTEMEQFLGAGIPIEDLNAYYYWMMKNLPNHEKSALYPANSIWIRNCPERIQVPTSFLQTTADYYSADAFYAPFDLSTAKDINHWIDEKTHRMIPKIFDEQEGIPEDAIMYLINALAFEAEWAEVYEEYNVKDGTFIAYDGTQQDADMMHSTETIYMEHEGATGFMKHYKGYDYCFAAVLPPEDVSITDYVNDMTGESLRALLNSRTNKYDVYATMPKFDFDYNQTLNDTLCTLGIPTAFDPNTADFSGLNTVQNSQTYIGSVVHSTHITVNETGTRAAAVTIVGVCDNTCIPEPRPTRTVTLDRPFLFMILDEVHQTPIFIGTLMSIE